ncbi:MAG: two-component regulator propeller domain-containing protein [Edaphocola sp.]
MRKEKFTVSWLVFAAVFIGGTHLLFAQNGPAVEQWRSYLPYNQVQAVATDGTTFFCGTSGGFFTYNRDDGSLASYAKETGMADVGLTAVAYDNLTQSAILAYENSNLDIYKDGAFYNIPDIKLAQVSGDKTIYQITAQDGIAYLSSPIGLVLVNMTKKEIKSTVIFYDNSVAVPVYATTLRNDSIFAVTDGGVYVTTTGNSFIQNPQTWTHIGTRKFSYIASTSNQVLVANNDSVYGIDASGNVSFLEKMQNPVAALNAAPTGIWISSANADSATGYAVLRSEAGEHTDSIATRSPTQIVQLANGEVWYGDNSRLAFPNDYGFRKKITATENTPYIPQGPVTLSSQDIYAYNGEFWVAHGGKTLDWGPLFSHAMFSQYSAGSWANMQPWVTDNDWFQDAVRVLRDEDRKKLYVASYGGGLYERTADGSYKVYYGSDYFSVAATTPDVYYVSGLALDNSGNLWMTNNFGVNELVVKTTAGNWYKMQSVAGNSGHTAFDVVVDDYDQKWFIAYSNGGAVVYNDNGTIENTTDDQYRILKTGSGSGNLPSNNTTCIAKDKDGAIWIGTADGIAVVNCPGDVIAGDCEGTLPVVTYDDFNGLLFTGQSIRAIAVDGANRKWVGTSNGVWLLSEDADSIVYRFTEDTSPLPSNSIQRINIDPVTGDVYISTDKGVTAFRSTATEGSSTMTSSDLYIYPNPVPSNYEGMIAVRGLAENADVRFTDITGQLVYRTKALGGQAVWNGYDYTGSKAQSGVYLVFAVSKDGTQKAKGKFILQR